MKPLLTNEERKKLEAFYSNKDIQTCIRACNNGLAKLLKQCKTDSEREALEWYNRIVWRKLVFDL